MSILKVILNSTTLFIFLICSCVNKRDSYDRLTIVDSTKRVKTQKEIDDEAVRNKRLIIDSIVEKTDIKVHNEKVYKCYKTILNKDGTVLKEIHYRDNNLIGCEYIYGTYSDSFSYGIGIFYNDTLPYNKIEYVETIPILKSSRLESVQRFSQKYFKKAYPTDYKVWIKRTVNDKKEHQINTW